MTQRTILGGTSNTNIFPIPNSGEIIRSQFINVMFNGGGPIVAGDMFASPVYIPASRTFNAMVIIIWTGTASSLVRLGMYADDGTGQPGKLINDYGTVDSASGGTKSISINYSGVAGTLVWLVGVPQVACPTYVTYNISSSTWGPLTVSKTSSTWYQGGFYWYVASVTGALPSSPIWTLNSSGNSTRLAVIGLQAA